jgi:hypothetical protein
VELDEVVAGADEREEEAPALIAGRLGWLDETIPKN